MNKTKPNYLQGLSYLEVLMVLAILAVISLTAFPAMTRYVSNNNYLYTIDNMNNLINKARSNALNQKEGTIWGICRVGDNVSLYSEFCGNNIGSEEFTIPSRVNVSGLNDVNFSLRTGQPSQSQVIVISSGISSHEIRINSIGGVE